MAECTPPAELAADPQSMSRLSDALDRSISQVSAALGARAEIELSADLDSPGAPPLPGDASGAPPRQLPWAGAATLGAAPIN